jgi:hypothetical protein
VVGENPRAQEHKTHSIEHIEQRLVHSNVVCLSGTRENDITHHTHKAMHHAQQHSRNNKKPAIHGKNPTKTTKGTFCNHRNTSGQHRTRGRAPWPRMCLGSWQSGGKRGVGSCANSATSTEPAVLTLQYQRLFPLPIEKRLVIQRSVLPKSRDARRPTPKKPSAP